MHQSIFSCAHAFPPVHFRSLGSFNSDDGKGSENVFTKMNVHFSNFVACIQTIVLLLMSSSSSLDRRRVVDCKSSPFGLVLGSTHDIILWEMLIRVNPYLLDLAGKGLMLSPWGSLSLGAHTTIRC